MQGCSNFCWRCWRSSDKLEHNMCKSQQKRWKEKYEGNPSMNSVTCTYHTIIDSITAYNTVLLCWQVLVGLLVAVPNKLHFLLNITDSPAIFTVLLQNFFLRTNGPNCWYFGITYFYPQGQKWLNVCHVPHTLKPWNNESITTTLAWLLYNCICTFAIITCWK